MNQERQHKDILIPQFFSMTHKYSQLFTRRIHKSVSLSLGEYSFYQLKAMIIKGYDLNLLNYYFSYFSVSFNTELKSKHR